MSNTDYKVTIAIIFHNQINTVKRCMDSVINQDYQNLEIICVDDASSDGTYELLRKYEEKWPNVIVNRLERNSSANISRKTGIEMASGEYLLMLDGDDCLSTDACKALIEEEKNESVDILHFKTNIINSGNYPQELINGLEKRIEPLYKEIHGKNVFAQCYIYNNYAFTLWNKMYRTELLKRAYSMIETIPIYHGHDLYQYFVISQLAQSYRGISDKLYDYYYGDGISGYIKVKEDQFYKQCDVIVAAHLTMKYARQYGDVTSIHAAKELLSIAVNECINRADKYLEGGWKVGIRTLLQLCGVEYLLSGLSSYYCEKNTDRTIDELRMVLAINEILHEKEVDFCTGSVAIVIDQSEEDNELSKLSLLIDRLLHHGIKVTILSDSHIDSLDSYGIEYIGIPNPRDNDFWSMYEHICEFKHILESGNFDLVIHDTLSGSVIWDYFVCKSMGVKLCCYYYNQERLDRFLDDDFRNYIYLSYLVDGFMVFRDAKPYLYGNRLQGLYTLEDLFIQEEKPEFLFLDAFYERIQIFASDYYFTLSALEDCKETCENNKRKMTDMESNIGALEEQLDNANYHIVEIRKSYSFKIGRIITYIPRLIRHVITDYPI